MSVDLGTTEYTLSQEAADFIDRKVAGHLIEGEVRESVSGETFPVLNPTTGETIMQAAACATEDLDAAVASGRRAFEDGRWRHLPPVEKEARLRRLATLLEQSATELGDLDSLDAGLLRKYGEFITSYSAGSVNYYAGWPTKLEGLAVPSPQEYDIRVEREPIGVFAHILPWNGPTAAINSVSAALSVGNSVVLKPAEQTPMTAVRLGEIALEAGIPPGVFNVLQGTGTTAGAGLVAHRGIDGVHFTGSAATGRRIAASAAQTLKRASMELGGKSAFIVFDDADLDQAVPSALIAAWNNAGQVCTNGARTFVQRGVYEEFMARALELATSYTVSSAFDPAASMGPMVSAEQHAVVARYLDIAADEGVEVAFEGAAPELGGYFHAPRIFTGVRNEMRIAQEEIFGPILSVLVFDDEDETYAQANDNEYGLTAGVWTANLTRAHHAARALRTGTVWINTYMKNEVSAPYGGVKQSGYGRNLGAQSLENYLQTKTVWVGGL